MAGVLFLIIVEVVLFFAFLYRKTKLGKRVALFLMKKQGIARAVTMRDIDERIDELTRKDDA